MLTEPYSDLKLVFIGAIIFGMFVFLTFMVPSAEAAQTITITPVKESVHEETGTILLGSRIPGCQDPVIVNGTVIREAGCYTPNDITVKPGTLIIFKNDDISAHSFTSVDFNSQLMINDGSEYSWVASDFGKTTYSCLLHPWASGSITVVSAPTLDDFNQVPAWVTNIFNWYNDDIIDYNTFMNAIIYLMSFSIIEEYSGEVESESEIQTTSTTTPESEQCENARGTTLRKQLGCDLPQEDTRTLEEKCEATLSAANRNELGCP